MNLSNSTNSEQMKKKLRSVIPDAPQYWQSAPNWVWQLLLSSQHRNLFSLWPVTKHQPLCSLTSLPLSLACFCGLWFQHYFMFFFLFSLFFWPVLLSCSLSLCLSIPLSLLFFLFLSFSLLCPSGYKHRQFRGKTTTAESDRSEHGGEHTYQKDMQTNAHQHHKRNTHKKTHTKYIRGLSKVLSLWHHLGE